MITTDLQTCLFRLQAEVASIDETLQHLECAISIVARCTHEEARKQLDNHCQNHAAHTNSILSDEIHLLQRRLEETTQHLARHLFAGPHHRHDPEAHP